MVIWLGHSAYYMQLAGKRILIDSVLSDHAAPFSFLIKAFEGTTLYQAEDIPKIDYLLISHDHYDHLDYLTVTQLENKVKNVIVPLGVGTHFEYWGYPVATPMLLEGESSIKIFWDNFWKEKQQTVPKQALPSIKTNLHALW